jgi:restriction endonuclease
MRLARQWEGVEQALERRRTGKRYALGRGAKVQANFERKQFRELWDRINRKAAYTVHFDSDELISECVPT